MKYTVYETTNTANGKTYIGAHITSDPDDAYLGSGMLLRRAIKKYGETAFLKRVVAIFDTPEEMFQLEAELVDEAYVRSANTYNVKRGGQGGWDYVNVTGLSGTGRRLNSVEFLAYLADHPESHERLREGAVKGGTATYTNGTGLYAADEVARSSWRAKGVEAALTERARAKQKQTLKSIEHQAGDRNSQYGTKWVCNPTTREIKKVAAPEVDNYLSSGWIRGRKLP